LVHYGKKSFSFSDNFLRITLVAKEINVDLGGKKGGVIGGQIDGVIDTIKELTHSKKKFLKLSQLNIGLVIQQLLITINILAQ
jgi:hypothetical protein